MKILKPGVKGKYYAECNNCGCIFIYGEEEYKIEQVTFNVTEDDVLKSISDKRHVIMCPQCDHIIKYTEDEYRYHNLEDSDELTELYYNLWKNNNGKD